MEISKKILIQANQREECWVSIIQGRELLNLDIESNIKEQKKANIYKGKITRIEASLEAAFVDYGAERHGFLSLKDVAREYFAPNATEKQGRLQIKDVLYEGQEVIVQVDKEERGNKGAALSTFISLAGCYLVLIPNNPRAAGISKRIEGDDRDDLRGRLESLELPEGMGLIARTASAGKNRDELGWDLQVLLNRWQQIQEAARKNKAPILIHQESGILIRTIRDHLREDISEVIIDNKAVWEQARNYVKSLRPEFVNKVKFYSDAVPLFNRFHIDQEIESVFQREVRLSSGGALVIDRTEALVSIDINSSRATKGDSIEETAVNTNLEAADEIAKQLRLRDLAGLIVIDFIDMSLPEHQREVENRLRDALRNDRARVQIGRISRFGLLEMSRQRLGPPLGETIQEPCPRCNGLGFIRGVESLSLAILRTIEKEALRQKVEEIHVQIPVECGTFLLNEKREAISNIEKRHDIRIVIIPNRHLETPHYHIECITSDSQGRTLESTHTSSYMLAGERPSEREHAPTRQFNDAQPAIQSTPGVDDVAARRAKSGQGLIRRIWSSLFGADDETATSNSQTMQRRESSEGETTETTASSEKESRYNRTGEARGPNRRRANNPRQSTNPRYENTTATETNIPPSRETTDVAGKTNESEQSAQGNRRGSGQGQAQGQQRRGSRGGTRRRNENPRAPLVQDEMPKQQAPSHKVAAAKPASFADYEAELTSTPFSYELLEEQIESSENSAKKLAQAHFNEPDKNIADMNKLAAEVKDLYAELNAALNSIPEVEPTVVIKPAPVVDTHLRTIEILPTAARSTERGHYEPLSESSKALWPTQEANLSNNTSNVSAITRVVEEQPLSLPKNFSIEPMKYLSTSHLNVAHAVATQNIAPVSVKEIAPISKQAYVESKPTQLMPEAQSQHKTRHVAEHASSAEREHHVEESSTPQTERQHSSEEQIQSGDNARRPQGRDVKRTRKVGSRHHRGHHLRRKNTGGFSEQSQDMQQDQRETSMETTHRDEE